MNLSMGRIHGNEKGSANRVVRFQTLKLKTLLVSKKRENLVNRQLEECFRFW